MKSAGIFFSARLWTGLAFVLGVMPLCLSSIEMWDGVVGILALTSGDWATLKGWLLDSNWYLTYGLFLLADGLHQLTALPYWVFFKLWIILLIIGIACEVHQLALNVFEVPASIARWMPALIFSFPLWYVFFSYTPMLGHLTCVWLALLGYRWLHKDSKWQVAGGVIFVAMSFQLASNCAFILALELGCWLLCKDKVSWRYGRSACLLLLALGIFAATRVVWPPVGTYLGYNRFLNPLLMASWVAYAKYAALFGTWLVLVMPVMAGFWWTFAKRDRSIPVLQKIVGHPASVGAVLVFLMFSACLPYIAVGVGSPLFVLHLSSPVSVSAVLASNSASGSVSVWYGGWGARHILLMMIPLALFAGWLTSVGQSIIAPGSKDLCITWGGAFVAMVCLGLGFGVPGHWFKLQRIAKEHAVVQALAGKPQLPHGQVDLVLDRHVDYLGYIYETNYLLYGAYKGTHWAALMLPDVPAVKAWGDEHRRLTLNQTQAARPMIAKLNLMFDYSWTDNCKTVAKISLPKVNAWDVLWRAEHSPERLPAAEIMPVSSNCLGANSFWR